MGLADMNYKDQPPLKTIGRIKDILGDMGLLPVESAWRNSLRGFYSVTVSIAGTDLSTNGKGVSPEYALASAYGEMMERLQNQCTFRLSFDLSATALEYLGFFYAPDEKRLTTAELLAGGGEWLAEQVARFDPAADLAHHLKQWQAVAYEDTPADFIALPYCNLHTGNLSDIPVKMVSKMYMSNGMCAGNTPEEALVQGISELCERHVNQRVVQEKLVPPTIPAEYLNRYPRIAAMVAAIEASGNCRVVLKDCSLGQGYPVVAVVYINRDNTSYFVKFGSHPRFEIAAERTLTELLQGQDIRKMMGMREFSFPNGSDDAGNLMGILVNGSGVYPSEFFGPRPDYGFCGWAEPAAVGNRELLRWLLDLLAAKGFAAYARDVSFLGFPSFHVIVPGFSEIETFDDVRAIEEYADYNVVRKLIRRIGSLSSNERQTVVDFLHRLPYSPDATVTELLNLPVADADALPWYYANLDLLLTAVLYRSGEQREAAAVFARFVEHRRHNGNPKGILTYYKCVRDYLAARASGQTDEGIAAVLGLFYPAGVIEGVVGEFSDHERLIGGQGNLACFNCGKCPVQGSCLHQATERVFCLLKERYAANPIDQRRLAALVGPA